MAIMQATAKTGADVAPAKPFVRVFVDGTNGAASTQTLQIPQSHDDMMGLLAQRRVLNEQLEQATDRRNDLLEQLNQAPAAAKAGFQGEINVVNDRIIQLESSLNVIGQEMASASPSLMSMAEEQSAPAPGSSDDFDNGVGAGVAGTFVTMTVLFFFWRRRWKRSGRKTQPLMPSADSERLQRLENGMEAMAIEIERISEGQRFVTKLLSESRAVESAPR
jgi:predicted PurR-regulated permease PerM